MGSTTLALTIAAAAALDFGTSCVVFSPTLTESELARRLVAMRARVSGTALAKGRISETVWPRILQATSDLSEAPLYIDDSPHLELQDIESKLATLASRVDASIDLVIVDDAHLLSGEPSLQAASPAAARVLFKLDTLARQYGYAVLATVKVTAEAERRIDKRPLVREIPGYEDVARRPDLVLLLYRDDYYDYESEREGEIDVIVAENRRGQVGDVTLTFEPRSPRILDFARPRG